jgi:hypothetical protein
MVKTLVLIAALAATGASAADTQEAARPVRQKRTVIHFGEDDIRGGITRPDGELVQAPRKPHDESLLRVRKSFADRALAAPLAGR